LIEKLENCDIVITSRFLKKNSLENWPLQRIFLTRIRHVLIFLLLSISYDASGAFRCINCEKVTLSDLILAKNNSYAYFWESIFILHKKKYRIGQIPIRLSWRMIGSSKMTVKDVFISASYLMIVFLKKILGKYNFK
jgi:dolichol-phosphate mannosyltransferase